MERPVLALVLLGCLIAGGSAQCNPDALTQGQPGAACEPVLQRTARRLQEADTFPGLGGLMQGINGIGNMGQVFSRVGQFFSNMRPAGGAGAGRGGGQEATELTPVRESPSRSTTPRPSRSSDRLESGRPSGRSSEPSQDRSSRSEGPDRDDHDSRQDSVAVPRSERGRDRDSRSDRRSSSREGSSRSEGRGGSRSESRTRDRSVEAAARAQPATALYAPQFVEVTPLQMMINQVVAQEAAPAAANRKIGAVPK